MATRGVILALFACLAVCTVPAQGEQYYQYDNQAQTFPLDVLDTLVTIRISAAFPGLLPEDLAARIGWIAPTDVSSPLGGGFYLYRVTSGAAPDSFLAALREAPEVDMANPTFRLGDDNAMWMTNEILATYSAELTSAGVARTLVRVYQDHGERIVTVANMIAPRCVVLCLCPGSQNAA